MRRKFFSKALKFVNYFNKQNSEIKIVGKPVLRPPPHGLSPLPSYFLVERHKLTNFIMKGLIQAMTHHCRLGEKKQRKNKTFSFVVVVAAFSFRAFRIPRVNATNQTQMRGEFQVKQKLIRSLWTTGIGFFRHRRIVSNNNESHSTA